VRRERDELQRLLDKFERHMAEVTFIYLLPSMLAGFLFVVSSTAINIFTARCYASVVLAMGLCPCLCLSQAGVLLKRQNVGSHKQHHMIPQGL